MENTEKYENFMAEASNEEILEAILEEAGWLASNDSDDE